MVWFNDGSEQASSNLTSNHVDCRALGENLQSVTALKQPPARKMIHKILPKIKLRYQKFELAYNVTFVCYSAETGALTHQKWNRKNGEYKKPIHFSDETYNLSGKT